MDFQKILELYFLAKGSCLEHIYSGLQVRLSRSKGIFLMAILVMISLKGCGGGIQYDIQYFRLLRYNVYILFKKTRHLFKCNILKRLQIIISESGIIMYFKISNDY